MSNSSIANMNFKLKFNNFILCWDCTIAEANKNQPMDQGPRNKGN